LASTSRWLVERNRYPHLSYRDWVTQIDEPRMRNNLVIRSNPFVYPLPISRSSYNTSNLNRTTGLPSIFRIPILNNSYNTANLDRNLVLPPVLNPQSNVNNTNNPNSTNNTNNQYRNNNNNAYNQSSTNNTNNN
jgi:hypothetical protein